MPARKADHGEFSPKPMTDKSDREVADPPRWLKGDRLDRREWPDESGLFHRMASSGPASSSAKGF